MVYVTVGTLLLESNRIIIQQIVKVDHFRLELIHISQFETLVALQAIPFDILNFVNQIFHPLGQKRFNFPPWGHSRCLQIPHYRDINVS